jgi:2-isopropylmalate synthase
LGYLAGADRIEGCLFGNGERTGNVDLVALGINLFTQGIDPQIDFSDLDMVKRTAEHCNQLPVHERSPWAGDLVYTAFSGSHQDAIKKGFEAMAATAASRGVDVDELEWAVPYLPVDPKDLGRSYEAVIRVNSQSGKGGVAYLLKADHAIDLPRKLQIEFSGVVQSRTDSEGGEMTSAHIWSIFRDEYLPADAVDDKWGRFELTRTSTSSDMSGETTLDVDLRVGDAVESTSARGTGPIAAFIAVLDEQGVQVKLYDYVEHTLSASGDAQAAAYVELDVDGTRLWGVGIDADISTASLKAVVSAVNRAVRSTTDVHELAAV